jgi:hypothetical protein
MPESKKVITGLANIAFERARVFGTPLGQMEEDLENEQVERRAVSCCSRQEIPSQTTAKS